MPGGIRGSPIPYSPALCSTTFSSAGTKYQYFSSRVNSLVAVGIGIGVGVDVSFGVAVRIEVFVRVAAGVTVGVGINDWQALREVKIRQATKISLVFTFTPLFEGRLFQLVKNFSTNQLK